MPFWSDVSVLSEMSHIFGDMFELFGLITHGFGQTYHEITQISEFKLIHNTFFIIDNSLNEICFTIRVILMSKNI